MIELNVLQGSPEWHEARASNDCASEAAAALGLSKQCTRSELMKIKHTGLTPDVSEWTQKFLFDKGHEIEALARPIVEKRIGKELFPLTGLSDDKRFLASLDGMEIEDDMVTLGDLLWENKMLNPALRDYIVENNDLPDTHWPQCEQQLLVTGAKQVYFTVSDGTEEGTTGIFYESKPERRQRLISGWAQFNEDLFSYELPEIKPAAVAEAIEDLPALTVQLVGQVTASNLATFQTVVMDRIKAINTTLVTDNDFATADKMVKFLDDGEKRLDLVKSQALSQTASIDELFRTIDSLKAEMRSKRLTLDKLVKSEKENRKAEIVTSAHREFSDHLASLLKRTGVSIPSTGNFGEAIKGLKSLDSMRDKVSVALANAKIEANAIADRIDANRKTVEDMSLFPDFAHVGTKAPDDFAALLAMRTNARKEAEEKRLEAERERIRAEEQAKAQAEQRRIAEAEQADRTRIAAEEIRKLDAERKAAQEAAAKAESERLAAITAANQTQFEPNNQPQAITHHPDAGNMVKLGEICNRLGFNLTAEFLASLGFSPRATDKNARLYLEADFPAICRALVRHINDVATGTVLALTHTQCEGCGGINCQRVEEEYMTCGDCDHLCGEECGHHGREVNTGDSACDYFALSNVKLTGAARLYRGASG